MKSALARHLLLVLCSALALIATLGLGACGAQQEAGSIRIGTMPTEDILPMWVAEQEGLFDEAGVKAEIVVFDSAQSLSAALTAGEVDIAMTDPMRAVKLCESDTDLTLEWITLGTTPAASPRLPTSRTERRAWDWLPIRFPSTCSSNCACSRALILRASR